MQVPSQMDAERPDLPYAHVDTILKGMQRTITQKGSSSLTRIRSEVDVMIAPSVSCYIKVCASDYDL